MRTEKVGLRKEMGARDEGGGRTKGGGGVMVEEEGMKGSLSMDGTN